MLTIIIIIITAIVSVYAFGNASLFGRLKFNAYSIRHHGEWYRFFSYTLLHADWTHLLVNLFVLYLFGNTVESGFRFHFEEKARFYYLLLYIGGTAFSAISSYRRHNNNIYYNAVGASGAVSAVLFSSILLNPSGSIMFLMIPVPSLPRFLGLFTLLILFLWTEKALITSDIIPISAELSLVSFSPLR